MECKSLCDKLRRFGGCLCQQSASYNQYTLLRDPEPRLCKGSDTFAIRASSQWARAGASTSPGGRSTMISHHNLGSTNSQKILLFQVAKCHWPLWGTWQGGGRPGVGLGSTHYKKIKGFYKKCYKLVSKENPREAGGGSREGGGKRVREGPNLRPLKTGWEGRCGESREGDTKCITVPPQTPLRGGGAEAAVWGMVGLSRLPAGDPTGTGTA